MASFVKFNQFVQDLGDGVHNLNSDVLAIYLSDTAPNVSTAKVKADVPEISLGHGYTGPIPIMNSYSQSLGIASLFSAPSVTVTASGGSVGPFRYIVLYNSTASGGPLISYWDYGSELTLLSGSTLTANFGANVFTVQ